MVGVVVAASQFIFSHLFLLIPYVCVSSFCFAFDFEFNLLNSRDFFSNLF